MKIRTDFVTNSSSSSFILARKGGLNDDQKKALLAYVENLFINGTDVITTIDELDKYAKDNYLRENDEDYIKMKEAIENGLTVSVGWVSYDEAEYDLASTYEDIWKIMKEKGDGNFDIIDGDLSY